MDVDEHVRKCGFVVSGCVKGSSLALWVNFCFPLNFWPTLYEVFVLFCFDWNMNNYTLLADKRSEHMMVSMVGRVLSTDQALWQRYSCICIVSHFFFVTKQMWKMCGDISDTIKLMLIMFIDLWIFVQVCYVLVDCDRIKPNQTFSYIYI